MLNLRPDKCLKCGACVPLCRFGALILLPRGIKFYQEKCTLCLECVSFCPVRALEPASV